MSAYKCVLLFGPPASGKGLQGRVLSLIPGIVHSSMGEVFRNLDKNSETGKLVTEYTSAGHLVPDELTVRMWVENIQKLISDKKYDPSKEILFLDGIPRTLNQAKKMDTLLNVLKIIHLHVPDKKILIDRIAKRNLVEGRADDANPEIIKKRLEVYETETSHVLEDYPPEKIVKIDAFLTPMEVLHQILEALIPLFNK